jgi:hypothetical protein
VQVPAAIKPQLGAHSLSAGAVIVTGQVERQDFEWRVRAQSIQSLEAIWSHAFTADRFVIDLSKADRRILKAVLRILKRFPGHVPVEATGTGAEPKRPMANVNKLAVLPCPPLEDELTALLGPGRLSAPRKNEPRLAPAESAT